MNKKIRKQAYSIKCYGHYFDHRCSRELYQFDSIGDALTKTDEIIRNIIYNDKLISKNLWQQRDELYQKCFTYLCLFHTCHIPLVGTYAVTICIDFHKIT
jgi:hypothetical protein